MFIICWLALCALVGKFAQNKGRNFWTYALLSAIISPIGGFIVLLVKGNKNNETVAAQYVAPEEQYQPKEQAASAFLAAPAASSPAEPVFCVKCGALIDADTKFCPSCGAEVTQEEPTPGPKAQQDMAQAHSMSTVKERLMELKSLLDDGLISQEDFDKKKSEILGI